MLDDILWEIDTRKGFSCRWYLGQGTILRDWNKVIASSRGGFEIWRNVSKYGNGVNGIYDTRRINRRLRKMILVN